MEFTFPWVGTIFGAIGAGVYAMHSRKDGYVKSLNHTPRLSLQEIVNYLDDPNTPNHLYAKISGVAVPSPDGAPPGPAGYVRQGAYTTAQLAQVPVLYSSLSVSRTYEQRVVAQKASTSTTTYSNKSGTRTATTENQPAVKVSKWKTCTDVISNNVRSVPFCIQDGNHTLRVITQGAKLAFPVLVDKTEPAKDGATTVVNLFTQAASDTNMIGETADRRTISYHFLETALLQGQMLFLCGEITKNSLGQIILRMPLEDSSKPFIISTKTEEDILVSESVAQRSLKNGYLFMFGVGIAAALIQTGYPLIRSLISPSTSQTQTPDDTTSTSRSRSRNNSGQYDYQRNNRQSKSDLNTSSMNLNNFET